MLAMDVVDTLRHREATVERELASGQRDEQLKQRLRQIYASQGISVTDQILQEGIDALQQGRFVYQPPAGGAATRWAHFYVRRGRWGKGLLGLLAVALILFGVYWFAAVQPRRALVKNIETVHAQVLAISRSPAADSLAKTLYEQASTAAARGQQRQARDSYQTLTALREQLESSYTLRVAAEPDSGFWRVPDVNLGARNYYIVVEAFGPTGARLTLPILNEETGQTQRVSQWGLRVDEATFNQVRDDKLDDGIIQNSLFGQKQAGYLQPDYYFPTTGAAVTDWSEW